MRTGFVLSLFAVVVAYSFHAVSADEQYTQMIFPVVLSETLAGNFRDEPIRPIPAAVKLELRKVLLGESLFHDNRLSGDDSISCASCHALSKAGAEHRPHSVGIRKAVGPINAPTVFNTRFNVAQFWDGRAATLEEQAAGPVHNPIEMGSNWTAVIDKLNRDEKYVARFVEVYGGEITAERIADAIATYERSLLTLNSPFDRYLRGDETAVSAKVKEGYILFKSYGCVSCHQGVNVGGNMFQKLGTMGDYFADRGNITEADYGRFNVTGDEEDRFVFKVPSLRLVTRTAPYFHDGTVKSLKEAIRLMAKYQLGRDIEDRDVDLIVHFLESLSGEYQRPGPTS